MSSPLFNLREEFVKVDAVLRMSRSCPRILSCLGGPIAGAPVESRLFTGLGVSSPLYLQGCVAELQATIGKFLLAGVISQRHLRPQYNFPS
jgi:hypothetical protein